MLVLSSAIVREVVAPTVARAEAPRVESGEAAQATPISLDQALAAFRERGFDLLVADAAVRGAEADVRSAGAVANPALGASLSRLVGQAASRPPDAPEGWSSTGFSLGLSDQAALFDVVSGKRGLRREVAESALAAARLGRADAERALAASVKEAYLVLAAAREALVYARESQEFFSRALELHRLRYPRVIDEGQLARIEVAKLGADQAVDAAEADLRGAQATLAFFLGDRGEAPRYLADSDVLRFKVPAALASASVPALLDEAASRRPDVQSARVAERGAEAAARLARRERWPDVALAAQYGQIGTGTGAPSPPTVTFGVSLPVPLFHQRQGEVARADAERDATRVVRDRLLASVARDVSSAFGAFTTARRRVERLESSGLERARRARDVTRVQFDAGATTLVDFLDAERSYVEVRREYLDALVDYGTAVLELEKAVGGAL